MPLWKGAGRQQQGAVGGSIEEEFLKYMQLKRMMESQPPPTPEPSWGRANRWSSYQDNARSKPRGKGSGTGQKVQEKEGPEVTCKCCGNKGHSKARCHSKAKSCDECGKVGHLKVVCRQALAKVENAKTGESKPKEEDDKDNSTLDVGWHCGTCYEKCPKYSLLKCPQPKCPGKRPDQKVEEVTENTLLTKDVEKDISGHKEGGQTNPPAEKSKEVKEDEDKLRKLQAAQKSLEEAGEE